MIIFVMRRRGKQGRYDSLLASLGWISTILICREETVMKKNRAALCLKLGVAAIFAMAIVAAAAFADEAKPAAPLVSADDIRKALGISFYLQGGYTYNARASNGATQSSENDLRLYDHSANSFTLDLAEIMISRNSTTTDRSGYNIKLSTGETAKWLHARGMSGAPLSQAQTGDGTDAIDLTEAYLSYLAPIGKGLRFDLGKMVTYFGAETIEAIDNPNYSRSFLFNYAIPTTHTGLRMSYVFTETMNAGFYIVNGWDNAEDNNTSKSFGVSFNYMPTDTFSGYANFMAGPEQDSNSSHQRTLVDLVATIKPMEQLSFILNYDLGREDKAFAAGTENAEWSGISSIVKFDINDTYSLSLRGESFDDKDGFRTGIAQTLTEMTATVEVRLANGMVLRPEYRHDSSGKPSFDNGTKNSQITIALGAMYRW